MIVSWLIVLALAVLTVGIHYEVLRLLASHIDELELPFKARPRMVLVMLTIIATHIVEILLFAVGMYLAVTGAGAGDLAGVTHTGEFREFVYFSFVSYTTLGFGEIYPTAGLRIISGVEALTGLLMITWSASFTFLYMEKFWRLGHDDDDGGEAE